MDTDAVQKNRCTAHSMHFLNTPSVSGILHTVSAHSQCTVNWKTHGPRSVSATARSVSVTAQSVSATAQSVSGNCTVSFRKLHTVNYAETARSSAETARCVDCGNCTVDCRNYTETVQSVIFLHSLFQNPHSHFSLCTVFSERHQWRWIPPQAAWSSLE